MYRSHSCGELRASHIDREVTLAGWVQRSRDKGFMIWVDLRDRYGITQLIFDAERTSEAMMEQAKNLSREFVIQVTGTVIERESKNANIPTGAIELLVTKLEVLNEAKLPPFTIEDHTDGGEDIRMKYRYLDIRRNPVKDSLIFRHKVTMEVRKYLSEQEFIEVETPYLIKSTPEGARDFVVPSRMNTGQFYALPQSPQTFKQLLMVGGMDKYFQIVKCFRDEDLRADRQPEFTQIDCEMAFVEQEDVLNVFEGLVRHLLKEVHNITVAEFPRIFFDDAMRLYGNDKPDIRFGMEFGELNDITQHKEFKVFNDAELVVGIAVPGGASYTRKEIDKIIDWVRRPQVGALGMVYVKCNEDGTFKSSVDKFYDQEDLAKWAERTGAKSGDLICVLSGDIHKVRAQLSALRMEMAERLGLRDPKVFAPLWVLDFPLLELDEETGHYHAMHHPFTSPKTGQLELLDTDPGAVKANAYDLVLNGNEIGGGSIRIHDKEIQATMFKHLGFTEEEAKAQFGFLMDAFEYGAPPHGGLAFGLDRLVAILGGQETIRDFIAFPKNNSGRDVMIDAPAFIDNEQLKELKLKIDGLIDEVKDENTHNYPKFVKEVTLKSCSEKRYWLNLKIDENKDDSIVVILKNPSKADISFSDVTVNRVAKYIYLNQEKFIEFENIGNIIIFNLIPIYLTDSSKLKDSKMDIIDNKNLTMINDFCRENKKVIVAWGNHPKGLSAEYRLLKESITEILKENNNEVYYVDRISKAGNPKHGQVWGYKEELKKFSL